MPETPRTLRQWLTELEADPDVGAVAVSPATQAALLDLARVAAHASERIAAPITAFMAGVAFAGLDEAERAARVRALVDRLEARYGG
jgi:3-dehydroquinate dehydratase